MQPSNHPATSSNLYPYSSSFVSILLVFKLRVLKDEHPLTTFLETFDNGKDSNFAHPSKLLSSGRIHCPSGISKFNSEKSLNALLSTQIVSPYISGLSILTFMERKTGVKNPCPIKNGFLAISSNILVSVIDLQASLENVKSAISHGL